MRTRRTLDGKVEMVGVEGRTLTEVCGERADVFPPLAVEGKAEEWTEFVVDDVDEALE